MNYTVSTIVCGAYQENAYLLCAEGSEAALLIDPGDDLQALRRAILDSGRKLEGIVLTHGHFDHTLAAAPLAKEFGARVYIHKEDADMPTDKMKSSYNASCSALPCPEVLETTLLGEMLDCAGLSFQLLHTPGHTPGSICLYDEDEARLFSGDTLFYMGYGRVDLPGGSAKSMRNSLRMLLDLPEETKVYPGHGPQTSIRIECGRYGL